MRNYALGMKMMTVLQVAEMLNISESMVRKMVGNGELEPVRVGTKLLFPESYVASKFNVRMDGDVDLERLADIIIRRMEAIDLPGGGRIVFSWKG